jgi:DNA-binding transcriptional LysR family regulator
MLDLELIQLFIAVVERGNIAMGARAMGMSASFASRQLTALEKSLNSRLMVRTTRTLMLTDAGRAYLTWARDILKRHDQLLDDLSSLQRDPSGLIRIACQIYSGHTYLKDAIRTFKQDFPKVTFEIKICDRPAKMLSHGFDLAIDAGPMPPGNFVGRQIQAYRRVTCASPAYLARNPAPSHPRDLSKLVCLYNSLNEGDVWHFQSPQGVVFNQTVTPFLKINSYSFLRELALEGVGVICIGEHIVRSDIAAGRLVEVLPDFKCVDAGGNDFTVRLIYPAQQLPHRVRLFVDHLEALMHAKIDDTALVARIDDPPSIARSLHVS